MAGMRLKGHSNVAIPPASGTDSSGILMGPKLQKLTRWLVGDGLSQDRATLTERLIARFCLEHVIPLLGMTPQLGIAAKHLEYGGQVIWLRLLWPEPLSIPSPKMVGQMEALYEVFSQGVSLPL